MSKPQIKVPQPVLFLQSQEAQRRRLVWQLVLALLIAALLVGIGYGLANRQQVLAYVNGEETLRGQVRQLERALKEAQQELVLHQTAVEVSQQAQNRIRQELRNHHAQVTELEATVDFYKSIMSPESGEQRLRADNLTLTATDSPQAYNMALMLGQFGGEHAAVQGQVTISVKGLQDGEAVTLEQSKVMDKALSTRFSFRYFQELRGRIVLPDGFEPQQVLVQVVPDSRHLKNTDYSFDWSIKES